MVQQFSCVALGVDIFFKCHFLGSEKNLGFLFVIEEGNFLSNALSLLKKSLKVFQLQGLKPKR